MVIFSARHGLALQQCLVNNSANCGYDYTKLLRRGKAQMNEMFSLDTSNPALEMPGTEEYSPA